MPQSISIQHCYTNTEKLTSVAIPISAWNVADSSTGRKATRYIYQLQWPVKCSYANTYRVGKFLPLAASTVPAKKFLLQFLLKLIRRSPDI